MVTSPTIAGDRLWRITFSIALCLVCSACLAVAAAAELGSNRELYQELSPAVVGIGCEAPYANGGWGGYYGTGAVVSSDGLILTNITVVPEGAKDIKIYFTDGRVLPADLIAIDSASEGVLVDVEATDLTAMAVTSSAGYAVGDPVFAWGNPNFSIQRDGMVSLRDGMISGRYNVASIDDQSRYLGPVIESDAMLNGGTDGGPLTDARGQVIGLLSLAYANNRWLGTSIPIDKVAENMPQLAAVQQAAPVRWDKELAFAFPEYALIPGIQSKVEQAVVAVASRHRGDAALATSMPKQPQALPPVERSRNATGEAERQPHDGAVFAGVAIGPDRILTSATALGDRKKLQEVMIYAADGTGHRAEVLGVSPRDDVALLSFTATDSVTSLSLLPRKNIQIGRSAIIFARPQAPGSMTANIGRISATKRFDQRAIQLETASNYGNSGGPVIDLHGRLMGISAMLMPETPWRQNCGVGFMIPAQRLIDIIPTLERGEEPPVRERAFVGIAPAPFDGQGGGVAIANVVPNSPAAKAGMKPGDRITHFAGEAITSWYHLVELIDTKAPGDTVDITVLRGKAEENLKLTLAARGGR